MTQSTPELEVRTEAHPLKWEELSEGQQKAGDMVKALVKKFLAELPDKPDRPTTPTGLEAVLPRIDLLRTTNRVILIDGSRGSGKTALLVTLVHEWSEGVRAWNGRGRSSSPVPVGLVDLRPMPDVTSVLFSIVGSFHRLVEYLERDGSIPNRNWGGRTGDDLRLRQCWDRLLRSVSTWKRDLGERAKDLDPEQFVAEFTDTEQRRLHLDTAFSEFVDELAYVFQCSHGVAPLFVMAIDDADLNRTLSLELLDLLRKLWHRNVAYVLTGHKELFRLGVRCDFEKMFSGTRIEFELPQFGVERQDGFILQTGIPKGWLVSPNDNISVNTSAVGNAAVGLGHDWIEQIIEKLLPQGHVCSIPELKPEERFRLVEEQFARATTRARRWKSDAAREHPQGDLGAQSNSVSHRSFADYMRAEPQTMEALPPHFRPVLALGEWVAQNAERFPAAVPALMDRLGGARRPRVLQDREGALVLGGTSVELNISQMQYTELTRTKGNCPILVVLHAPLFPCEFVAHGNWDRGARGDVALWILAANVVAEDGGVVPPSLTTRLRQEWVAESYALLDEDDPRVTLTWAAPRWLSPEAYHHFFDCWRNIVEAAKRLPREKWDSVDLWARIFARLCIDVDVSREVDGLIGEDGRLRAEESRLSWRQIREDVNRLANGMGPGPEWARTAFWLLAAPEVGLPVARANSLLNEFVGRGLWSKEDLRKLRNTAVVVHGAKDAGRAKSEVLSRLSRRYQGHPWFSLLSEPSDAGSSRTDQGQRGQDHEAVQPVPGPTVAAEAGRPRAAPVTPPSQSAPAGAEGPGTEPTKGSSSGGAQARARAGVTARDPASARIVPKARRTRTKASRTSDKA